jgi:3-deoxy-D-manno-octulosonic-acid transferase
MDKSIKYFMGNFLYLFISYLITPIVILRLLLLSCKQPLYRKNLWERFGYIKPNDTNSKIIWLHAVSLGEIIASNPLVTALQQQYPQYKICISTTTASGRNQVEKLYGNNLISYFICYDLPRSVKRFIKRLQPSILILFEAEIWPNIIKHCSEKNIPVVVANARMSEKSAKNYSRFSFFFTAIFKKLAKVIAQDELSATRISTLGVDRSRIEISGNIKFDIALNHQAIASGKKLKSTWIKEVKNICVIAAVSTHENEEQQILDAFSKLQSSHSNVRLLLIPRHISRFDSVYQLASEKFTVSRYSDGDLSFSKVAIILGDTIGKMQKLLATTDIAFVGGSLVPVGGHNVLEPAMLGIPVVSGKYMFNFEFISNMMAKSGGLLLVNSLEELIETLTTLLEDKKKLQNVGNLALQFANKNRGSVAKHVSIIANYL